MTTTAELYPLIIYITFTVIIVTGLLLAASFFGSGGSSRNKSLPYESGIIPTGSARLATNVPFYLVAIFFIVFIVPEKYALQLLVKLRPSVRT